MKNRTINVIIFAGIFSILLVSIVQYVWADNLVNTERKQFNHKVKIALTNAGYKLRLIHHTSIDKIHLVKQISKESFIVEIQDIVNPSQIDSLLQSRRYNRFPFTIREVKYISLYNPGGQIHFLLQCGRSNTFLFTIQEVIFLKQKYV